MLKKITAKEVCEIIVVQFFSEKAKNDSLKY
jgi:hypothetical protein